MLTITTDETANADAFRTVGGRLYREAVRLATDEAETSDDPRLAGLHRPDAVTALTERLFRYIDGHSLAVDPRVFAVLGEGDDEGLFIDGDPDDVQPLLTDDTGAAAKLRADAKAEANEEPEPEPEVIPPTVDPTDRDQFPNIPALEAYMDEHSIDRTGLSSRAELETAVTAHHTAPDTGTAG